MVLAATALVFGYKRHIALMRRELDGFLSLIDYLKLRIECYLSTVGEVFRDFSNDTLEPFLKRVRAGESPESAIMGAEKELVIGKEGREILKRLFSVLGREYKAGVIASIDATRSAFGDYSEHTIEEGKRNVKLTSALLLGGVLGAVILLI